VRGQLEMVRRRVPRFTLRPFFAPKKKGAKIDAFA
jgi:hypothetical protein